MKNFVLLLEEVPKIHTPIEPVSQLYKFPQLTLIPNLERLVEHLARMYPLTASDTKTETPLLPSIDTYTSWPFGNVLTHDCCL